MASRTACAVTLMSASSVPSTTTAPPPEDATADERGTRVDEREHRPRRVRDAPTRGAMDAADVEARAGICR